MENKETINIVLCINNAFVMPAATLICSILENTKQNIFFHICYFNISNRHKKKLISTAKKYNNAKIDFINFDISVFRHLPINSSRLDYETYIRLLAFYELKTNKLLYLDVDIVVNDDISKLWNINFENNAFIACRDNMESWNNERRNNLPDLGKKYFNAGVLVVDTNMVKKTTTFTSIINYAKKYKEHLLFHDQDLINCIFADNIKEIEKNKFNMQEISWDQDISYINDAYIVHYSSWRKPWKAFQWKVHKQYIDLFWKYAKCAGYRKFPRYWLQGLPDLYKLIFKQKQLMPAIKRRLKFLHNDDN